MNNLITQNFNGYEIHTFVLDNKPCWIANELSQLLDYSNTSKILSKCIELENFEETIEYEILRGIRLKKFVSSIQATSNIIVNNKVRNLTIIYENGLYGFLQYSKNDLSKTFRKWIRRDLLPTLRESSYSQTSVNSNIASTIALKDKLTLEELQINIQKLDLAYKNIELLNTIMVENNISPQDKLATILKIYSDLNIELPLLDI